MHRLVFHFEPEDGLGRPPALDHPRRPPRPSERPAPAGDAALGQRPARALAFYGLFMLALGTTVGERVRPGFLAGYLVYDMTHYHVHHHRPRTRLGKLMRELHMRHHFQDDTRGFGVSAPFWDYVFGTPQKRRGRPELASRGEPIAGASRTGRLSGGVRLRGFEPPRLVGAQAPEAWASTSSATAARTAEL